MAHIGLAKLQELEKATADRERAVLQRMRSEETDQEEPFPVSESAPYYPEHQTSEVVEVPSTHVDRTETVSRLLPEVMPAFATAKPPRSKPAHSVELVYDSGREGITGTTDKFSVKVFASEINEDDDNISIVLDYDVLIKPPSYTELQVKIDNKQAVKVMMGGTIKHGDDRFLFLLKVK